MPSVLSVNVGRRIASRHTSVGVTGIDKLPLAGPVQVRAPGPRSDPGNLGSGLDGDAVCDLKHHGGDDQAVYAYAREDLDFFADDVGLKLRSGMFGENLTTQGIDVSTALIGETWSVGTDLLLEVSVPRIPCRTFAGFLQQQGWVKRFTEVARPGTYLRVLRPGSVTPGDPILVRDRPDHDVTVALAFRAMTTAPDLLPRLQVATALPAADREMVARRVAAARGTGT